MCARTAELERFQSLVWRRYLPMVVVLLISAVVAGSVLSPPRPSTFASACTSCSRLCSPRTFATGEDELCDLCSELCTGKEPPTEGTAIKEPPTTGTVKFSPNRSDGIDSRAVCTGGACYQVDTVESIVCRRDDETCVLDTSDADVELGPYTINTNDKGEWHLAYELVALP